MLVFSSLSLPRIPGHFVSVCLSQTEHLSPHASCTFPALLGRNPFSHQDRMKGSALTFPFPLLPALYYPTSEQFLPERGLSYSVECVTRSLCSRKNYKTSRLDKGWINSLSSRASIRSWMRYLIWSALSGPRRRNRSWVFRFSHFFSQGWMKWTLHWGLIEGRKTPILFCFFLMSLPRLAYHSQRFWNQMCGLSSSATNYLEIAKTPQEKGSAPQGCLPTSDGYKSGLLTALSSSLKICYKLTEFREMLT